MKKWLYRIFWIPILAVAVLFLVANRQPVAVSLDPFSASNPAVTTPPLPLWLWLMAMLFIGLGLGASGMWLSGREGRQKARATRREVKTLRKELAAAEKRASAEASDEADNDDLPLLESSPG